jgi:hypothetical protein
MSVFSPNLQLEEVARGGDLGTWDTPTNSNWAIMDSCIGNITTISLNNSNVLLSASQFQSKQIIFNSTLTGSVTITFPTSFTKSYEIYNQCTGAFTITLQTTVAGGQVICAPPGECVDVWNDSTNLRYKNFGRIGEYWDYASASIPAWITGCTVLPYLYCNGTTFSSATWPALATILGGNTLPDARGRVRYHIDNGTGRITGVQGSPNTVGSGGGDQYLQVHAHGNSLNDLGHTHNIGSNPGLVSTPAGNVNIGGSGSGGSVVSGVTGGNNSTPMSINNANAGLGGAQNLPPLYIGGITLIRAG